MRRVILKMHVSLDGFVRTADGDVVNWLYKGLKNAEMQRKSSKSS